MPACSTEQALGQPGLHTERNPAFKKKMKKKGKNAVRPMADLAKVRDVCVLGYGAQLNISACIR